MRAGVCEPDPTVGAPTVGTVSASPHAFKARFEGFVALSPKTQGVFTSTPMCGRNAPRSRRDEMHDGGADNHHRVQCSG